MKLAFIFVLAALLGYSSGLMIEAMGEGEQSKLHILANTGKFNQDWIPFFIDGELSKIQNLEQNAGFERLDIPKFVQIGHLYVDEYTINSANVAFNIGIHNVDFNNKLSLQNVVDQCLFHSPKSFEPLCIICRLLNDAGEVVGRGIILDNEQSYEQSTTKVIDISPFPEPPNPNAPFRNDVQAVHGVEITICVIDEGCTPGFWKNNHAQWPSGFSPSTKVIDAFMIDDASQLQVLADAGFTNLNLGQALELGGGGLNALLRHATAALLSQSTPGLAYPLSIPEIKQLVKDALEGNISFEDAKNILATANEAFCPLSASESEGIHDSGGPDCSLKKFKNHKKCQG